MFRVLITDSYSSSLEYYSHMSVWKKCGFEISGYVPDVKSTLIAAVQQQFDLIVCMHRPSSLHGQELLRKLGQKQITVFVLIISQDENAQDMRECFQLGAVDYLTEPVSEDALKTALTRVSDILKLRLMNTEYHQAMELVLSAIPADDRNIRFLEKLRTFLTEQEGKAITAEATATWFGFHPDYFGRYFKSRTGMTFREFHRNFTMEYAKVLLSSGRCKVSDVSRILGFSSADYFTRIFRQTTGMTPSEFKKI